MMKSKFLMSLAAVLMVAGCASPSTFTGYVHAECDPTTAEKVTVCRSTEMPVPTVTQTVPGPTQTVTVTATPTASSTPTSVPTQTASPTATPTTTQSPGGSVPAGVTLRQIDGGPNYNAKFNPGFPTSPSFFPIGVWFEGTYNADQVAFDKATGLNTYVMLTDTSRLDLIRAGGMYAMPQGTLPNMGTETPGYLTEDEPDMYNGWWGAPTAEQFSLMDRSVASLPKDGRAKYTNFGLGILSADDTSADAKRMVQQYQDYASADYYFYTQDPFEASRAIGKGDARLTTDQARRARNYGIVVERMRTFADFKKPTWGFVEVGGPFDYNKTASSYIKPDQVQAAVWHSIIGGARGIVFFNHSFGGPAITQHALRESYYAPVRAAVQSTTATIRSIAPALNSEDAIGLIANPAGVRTLAKWNNGSPVVIAGNEDNAAKSRTFTVKGSYTSVEVVGEGRTIPIVGGTFSDNFASGTSIHVYKLS